MINYINPNPINQSKNKGYVSNSEHLTKKNIFLRRYKSCNTHHLINLIGPCLVKSYSKSNQNRSFNQVQLNKLKHEIDPGAYSDLDLECPDAGQVDQPTLHLQVLGKLQSFGCCRSRAQWVQWWPSHQEEPCLVGILSVLIDRRLLLPSSRCKETLDRPVPRPYLQCKIQGDFLRLTHV